MEHAVLTRSLTKDFDGFLAVNSVNLAVPRGVFYGFLGPNGAGKSTTIKMLTGLLAPTSGSIEILGLDFASNPIEVKRQIGVVPEDLALFDRLTGEEYLVFTARMYGLEKRLASERAQELLEFMDLSSNPKKLIVDYSQGMKKKIALAAALIHSPKALFLDEPFESVDAIAAKTMKEVLLSMIARGATVFLTSHVLEIVERLCSHVGIVNRGALVAQGSLEELRAGVEMNHDGFKARAEGTKLTLEEIFVEIIGGARERADRALIWLTE